jgi:hypothetical protein
MFSADMAIPDWSNERCRLCLRFSMGDIAKATRKELEWYLIVLGNSRWLPGGSDRDQVNHKAETEAFSDIIRHMLMIRLGEELHEKSHRISVLALVVAVAAAVFAGLLWLADVQKHAPPAAPPVPLVSISTQIHGASSTLTEPKLLPPATQSAQNSVATNSTGASQSTPTNR